MSVTIMYRPMSDTGTAFKTGTHRELAMLEAAVGLEIKADAVPILRGMALAADSKFYREVADKVEQIGPITVWGEY